MTNQHPPVSPLICMHCDLPPAQASQGEAEPEGDVEPEVNFGQVQLKDPIVGIRDVISNEFGDGAKAADPLRAPKSMSKAEWERHCVTHRPFSPRMSLLRTGAQTKWSTTPLSRKRANPPLLVADY